MDERTDRYFLKIVETQKTRVSIGIFLALAMLTITGYAIQNNKNDLFLLAAVVPLIGLFIDTLIKYRVATPFLYKILTTEKNDEEPIGLVFLGFGKANYSGYPDIIKMEAGIARQMAFRRQYVFRNFWGKLVIYSIGVLGEVLLWSFL